MCGGDGTIYLHHDMVITYKMTRCDDETILHHHVQIGKRTSDLLKNLGLTAITENTITKLEFVIIIRM